MLVPKLYPYGQTVNLQARTLSLGGQLVVDAAQFSGSSINTILDYVQKIRDDGANGVVTVQLHPILYQLGGGAYSVTGVEFEGVRGTEIEFTGNAPVTRSLPDLAGYPTRRTVTTGCLGPMFVSDREPVASGITFRNIKFRGLTSTPLVSGDYSLISIVGDDVTFEGCHWTNEHSALPDLGDKAPYTALSKRNINTLTLVEVGEDRWVEPNPEWCRPCNRVSVRNCTFEGEPLAETAGAGPTLIAFRMRKCAAYQWYGNRFGAYYKTNQKQVADMILTANVANNDAVLVAHWNPFTKAYTSKTYTWKDAPNPAVTTDVQRHASSAASSALNMAAGINKNRIGATGGTEFVTALTPQEYMGPTAASLAAIRVQTLILDDPGPYNQGVHLAPWGANPGVSIISESVDAGGAITIREINGTQTVGTGYWQWGLIQEDCFRGVLHTTDLGCDFFNHSAFYGIATWAHNDFAPMRFSEDGHRTMFGWTGEQTSAGDALFHFAGSGFSNIYGMEFGIVSLGGDGSKAPVYKIEQGTHAAWWAQVAGTNADNGSSFEVHDSHGAVIEFFFRTVANPLIATDVQIGATPTDTLMNFRGKLQVQYDLHNIKAWASGTLQDGVAGAKILEITFVTWTKSANSPSVVKAHDGGGKLTALNNSKPYRPTHMMLDVQIHWPGTVTGGSPIVWAEKFYGELYIRGHFVHLRPLAFVNSSQAIHTITFVGTGWNVQTNSIIINSIAAGAPGNAVTFTLQPGGGVDVAGTTYFVDVTVNNTTALVSAALTAKIKQANTDNRAMWAFNYDPIVQVLDTAIGVNAGFVTSGGGPGIGSTIFLNFPFAFSDGAATTTTQGEHWPIVLKDVAWADIDVSAGPYTQGKYITGPGQAFPPLFEDRLWNTLATNDENGAFNGTPMKLLYVEKSAAAVQSKVKLRAMLDSSAWGTGVTGDARYYDLGPNMSSSDITVLASAIT